MLNVGLVTGSVTPSARAAPRTSVVLPAPTSPLTSTTSPSRRPSASSPPSASVCSGPVVSTVRGVTRRNVEAALAGAHTYAQGLKMTGPRENGARAGRLLLEGWRQVHHRPPRQLT